METRRTESLELRGWWWWFNGDEEFELVDALNVCSRGSVTFQGTQPYQMGLEREQEEVEEDSVVIVGGNPGNSGEDFEQSPSV